MKFTLAALATFLATSVLAAPAPSPEPWCMHRGQPCWKAKRAAEAFRDAITGSGGLAARDADAERSNFPGGAAYQAKRDVSELAGFVAGSYWNPAQYYSDLGLDEQFHPDSDDDTTAAAADGKEKREASPWCKYPGQPCWKKRDAAAEAEAVAADKRWCIHPGQPCWKAKRSAEAVLEAIGDDDVAKREAQPWCIHPGQPCWKKRDAEADADKRWCMHPGQPCWKAKRDVYAMRAAARAIIDSLE
ncbi:hypothetical protein AK830_g3429 [Neonectria ditissima]|uniref:Clock-controlled pheromone ccg-4 n=1 Tax=Neonectria ditissima TaxID=78410 RepID=A0A0P7B8W5_9HYPO|nr:hypothetical protein AK830_g3429 [Neonectria ditissima]